jgi:hypothetical protein
MGNRKKKKRSQPKRKQSSTVRNVALLFLSLGLLTGASMLFSYLGNRSDITLDPIQKAWSGMVAEDEKGEAPAREPETKSSAVGGYDYKFYEILGEKDGQDQGEEHYSIQVGAFRNKDHAKEFVQELGEKAKISLRIDKDGKLSCVRWGTFTTREAAERQCAKLSDKLQRHCVVVKM